MVHNKVNFSVGMKLCPKSWLMGTQIEAPRELDENHIASKSALSVPVCAVPGYSIDTPPFTLYGSSANQTKSIT